MIFEQLRPIIKMLNLGSIRGKKYLYWIGGSLIYNRKQQQNKHNPPTIKKTFQKYAGTNSSPQAGAYWGALPSYIVWKIEVDQKTWKYMLVPLSLEHKQYNFL